MRICGKCEDFGRFGRAHQGWLLALVDMALENSHVGKRAVVLVVVKTETDHEAVGDLETTVFDGNVHKSPRRLVEKGTNRQAAGLAAGQHVEQVA
jgi:hypothetical protein